ncbi:MAG TPA: DUF433 domain-containing protein, partial [Blastocatellia bacterium]|nr:DUF433 domain-containing protein [Blastocatellia bacterium]
MLEPTISAPLTRWEDGTIRITGSRVPIDTLIYHFRLGATAEEISYKFPSLQLADIYGAIYYYLAHRRDVEEYLSQQEASADAVQKRIESDPEYQQSKAEMRERLLAGWPEKRRLETPPAAD